MPSHRLYEKMVEFLIFSKVAATAAALSSSHHNKTWPTSASNGLLSFVKRERTSCELFNHYYCLLVIGFLSQQFSAPKLRSRSAAPVGPLVFIPQTTFDAQRDSSPAAVKIANLRSTKAKFLVNDSAGTLKSYIGVRKVDAVCAHLNVCTYTYSKVVDG